MTVALLVLTCLGSTVGWWAKQGGLQGRLVEVDRAELREIQFQVDLNQAEWPELAQLPGIGPTLARRIVESREIEGPFRDHDELVRIQGIGPKTLESVRPYLRSLPDHGLAADMDVGTNRL